MIESIEKFHQERDQETLIKFLNSSLNQDKFSFKMGGDIEDLTLKRNGKGIIPAQTTRFSSSSPTAWVGKDGSLLTRDRLKNLGLWKLKENQSIMFINNNRFKIYNNYRGL